MFLPAQKLRVIVFQIKGFHPKFPCRQKDIRIVKEYVDDGYSGSNFDRPSFQTMMEDIKRGVIDCVVVRIFHVLDVSILIQVDTSKDYFRLLV